MTELVGPFPFKMNGKPVFAFEALGENIARIRITDDSDTSSLGGISIRFSIETFQQEDRMWTAIQQLNDAISGK